MELTMEVVNARRRTQGSSHPQTLTALQNLAVLLGQTDRAAEGRNLLEGILRQSRQKLGDDHPQTVAMERSLAAMYLNTGKTDRALELAEHAAAQDERLYGSESPRALHSATTLGTVLRARGESDRALQLLEQTWHRSMEALGPDHERTLQAALSLAPSYAQAGRAQEALAMLEEALSASTARYGEANPNTISLLRNLASLAESHDQPTRAGPLFLRLAKAQREMLGKHDARSVDAAAKGARWLVSDGQSREAEALLLGVHADCEATLGPEHATTIRTMRNLAIMYREAGELEKSQLWQQKLAAATRATHGGSPPER